LLASLGLRFVVGQLRGQGLVASVCGEQTFSGCVLGKPTLRLRGADFDEEHDVLASDVLHPVRGSIDR
jgi:hypothetical protein